MANVDGVVLTGIASRATMSCGSLIDMANDAGGKGNTTVILARFVRRDEVDQKAVASAAEVVADETLRTEARL